MEDDSNMTNRKAMSRGEYGRPFKKNYTWSQMTEEVMLDLMIESITNGVGKGTDGKIKAETYAYVVENFNSKMGSSITKLNIDSRMKTWRKQYKGITLLREKKGFHWDDKYHRVVADYELWRDFIKKNDWAASFREKSFPLYDKLAIVFVNSFDMEAMEARFEDNATAPHAQLDSNMCGTDGLTKQDYTANDNTVDPSRNDTDVQAMPSRNRRRRLSPVIHHTPALPFKQRQRICTPDHPEFMSNCVQEVTNVIIRYLDEVKETVTKKLEALQHIEDKRLQKLSELEEQRFQLLAEIEGMKTQRVTEVEVQHAQRPLDFGDYRPQKVTEMEDKVIPKVTQKVNDDNCDEAYKYLMEIQELDDETIYASMQLLENKEKRKQFLLLPHEKRIGWLMWTNSNKKSDSSL